MPIVANSLKPAASEGSTMGVLGDTDLERRLEALHGASAAQEGPTRAWFDELFKDGGPPEAEREPKIKAFLADKMVALEKDKAEFCHQLIRATGARRIVEIGTSYGVSTVYLASALKANLAERGGEGVVIGTEYEPGKAAAARALYAQAGLASLIDLREGDLRVTLNDLQGPIDFVLMDIWIPMVMPAIERVGPHLKAGAVVVADNTAQVRNDYEPYFAWLAAHGFSTMTLPFAGGLEMSVKGG
ncbi:MAG TPA: class I SAM-dependent methyltransferase [Caulobacteraceae bacterium]|jgi:predicted O-methyltransferase YrrM